MPNAKRQKRSEGAWNHPRLIPVLLGLLGLFGCIADPEPTDDRPHLVPVSGKVTLDGEPMPGAVVTFLPVDDRGTVSVGETNDEGTYQVRYVGATGTAPGSYRVAVSYMTTPEGKPVSLSARSSLAPSGDMDYAEELLPSKYSDLGRSTLKAVVRETGGTFDFDLEGPLLAHSRASETPDSDVEEGEEPDAADPAPVFEESDPRQDVTEEPEEEPVDSDA